MHTHYDIGGLGGVVMQICLVGIISGYLVIAFQFWRERGNVIRSTIRQGTGEAATAFSYLMAIFILCSLAGYAPRLIVFPVPLMLAIHIALFISTWTYIATRQVVAIAAALSRG